MAARRRGSKSKQRSIPPQALIDPQFAAFSRRLHAAQNRLAVYLHRSGGPIAIDGAAEGNQLLEALPLPLSLQQQLEDSVLALNGLLQINLQLTSDPQNADVRVIGAAAIPFGLASDSLLGLSLQTQGDEQPGWEVLLALEGSDEAQQGYAGNHELGHTLGMEHAFEGADGDRAGPRSPKRSYFPDETVMAYRKPRSGLDWSQSWQRNDIRALAEVWQMAPGAQLPLAGNGSSRLRGSDADDVLIGGPGADQLQGFGGNDLLIDGAGADRLDGGIGFNRYRAEHDGDRDRLRIQADGMVDVVRSLGAEDRILLVAPGAAPLRLDYTAVEVLSFGTLTGIGIWLGSSLEVLVSDSSWELDQLQAATLVLGS
jgi:hypothetical protein